MTPAHDPFRGVPYMRGGGLEQPEQPDLLAGRVGEGYPRGGTVKAILAWAGDDPARRAFAVTVEETSDRPRATILALG